MCGVVMRLKDGRSWKGTRKHFREAWKYCFRSVIHRNVPLIWDRNLLRGMNLKSRFEYPGAVVDNYVSGRNLAEFLSSCQDRQAYNLYFSRQGIRCLREAHDATEHLGASEGRLTRRASQNSALLESSPGQEYTDTFTPTSSTEVDFLKESLITL